MKTSFALIFCISVILLTFLSGALKKEKPVLEVLNEISLYDRMTCMQDCVEHKVVGTVKAGETVRVLNRIQGKTKIIMRVESENVAGWIAYDDKSLLDINNDFKQERNLESEKSDEK
jgi:hypothetical protein